MPVPFAFILRALQAPLRGTPEDSRGPSHLSGALPGGFLVALIIGKFRPLVGVAIAALMSPAWAAQDLDVGMANTRNAKPAFVGEIRATYYGQTTALSPPDPTKQ